jgi:pimeloyl-ACP methyl ester carboxylesterase
VSLPDEFADFVGSVPYREVTLPFGSTRAWDLGEGPPVVCVHGIAGSRRIFFRLARHLAERRRVVVPHLRGEVEAAPRATLADYHDDLAALLIGLDLENVTLLGVSFGGYVVLSYAARGDPRVGAVAVQGTFARYPLRLPNRLMLGLSHLLPPAFGAWAFRRRVLEGAENAHLRRCAPGLDVLHADWCAKTPFATLRRRTRIIDSEDQTDAVRKITVPVSLGHGRDDRIVPLSHLDRLRSLLPDARVEIWDGVAHVASLTHPEKVADLVS